MAKKINKKLSLRRETLRNLDTLDDAQLRAVAGASNECGGGLKGTVPSGPSKDPGDAYEAQPVLQPVIYVNYDYKYGTP